LARGGVLHEIGNDTWFPLVEEEGYSFMHQFTKNIQTIKKIHLLLGKAHKQKNAIVIIDVEENMGVLLIERDVGSLS